MLEIEFDQFTRDFVLRLTEIYASNFASRILPLFDRMSEEATAAERDFYEKVRAQFPDADPYSVHEDAMEHGFEAHEDMYFVQQKLIGLGVAGLYHLWERLLKQFLNKEFRQWSPIPVPTEKLYAADFKFLVTVLADLGFRLDQKPFYAYLAELNLVANVVKHGDGSSCEKLRERAPRLFEGYHATLDLASAADTLELKAADFHRYYQATRSFWLAVPDRLAPEPNEPLGHIPF